VEIATGMALDDLGEAAAASGWRATVADGVARRVDSSPLPLNGRQVRAALGLGFLALSVRHVVETVRHYRLRAAPQPPPPGRS
jgi:hypothetical protein